MKMRYGLVSNSSSSSFIVVFPREPKDIADLTSILFKDSKSLEDPYENDTFWPAEKIATLVMKQIVRQQERDKNPKDKEDKLAYQIQEELSSFYRTKDFHSCSVYWSSKDNRLHKVIVSENFSLYKIGLKLQPPNAPHYNRYWRKRTEEEQKKENRISTEAYKQYEKDMNIFARNAYNQLTEKFKDKPIYLFSFSDNDPPPGSAMEHGNLFKRLPHIRISHH